MSQWFIGIFLAKIKHGPYGEPKNAADVETWTGSRFRYIGQTILPEARLYYYKARVYDPHYGRFLQTDPIGSDDDINLYAYTGGDPINGTDPTGNAGIGKVIKFARKLIKNKGNIKKSGKEVIEGTIDNIETLADGKLDANDAIAVVDLVTGLDKKDLKYIDSATKHILNSTKKDNTIIPPKAEHKKNKRKSSKPKHEKGQERKKRQEGGDKKRQHDDWVQR